MPSAKQPPLHPEDWLALVIAGQSHRSTNEGHRAFGKELLQRYFKDLPERYKDDETASAYFDAMLVHVASALRGFSFVREVFQQNILANQKMLAVQADAIVRLQRWSPVASNSVWPVILGGISGVGVTAALKPDLAALLKRLDPLAILMLTVGAVAGVFLWELAIDALVAWRYNRLTNLHTVRENINWRRDAAKGYQTVSAHFLRQAFAVTERFYGEEWKVPEAEVIDALVGNGFALIEAESPTEIVRSAKPWWGRRPIRREPKK